MDNKNTNFVTIPPGCKRTGLCTEKPIDYPTEIIDQEAKRLLKRSRRQSLQQPKEEHERRQDHNENCVEERQKIQPFLYVTNNTQHLVIQSGFYNQTVTAVTCKSERAYCLQSYWDYFMKSFYCETQYNSFTLYMYNLKVNRTETFKAKIPVACSCMMENKV